jgi:hypothetical protein
LAVFQILVIYVLTYWGYRESKMPGWFFDFVNSSVGKRLYPEKEYTITNKPVSPFNEDFPYIVEDRFRTKYSGQFQRIEDNKIVVMERDAKAVRVPISEDIVLYECRELTPEQRVSCTIPEDKCNKMEEPDIKATLVFGMDIEVERETSKMTDLDKMKVFIYE